MFIERISVMYGDEPGTHRIAADLLENAVGLGPDGRLDYRAAWLGSPAALGAFELHRDSDVTPQALVAVLQGRSARGGAQVRRHGAIRLPNEHGRQLVDLFDDDAGQAVWGLSSVEVMLDAPAELTQAWREADPEGRAEIERAMIAGADTALERARQATKLAIPHAPTGRRIHEFASGLAAVAIVQRPPGGGRTDVPLRVSVVVIGVECPNGELAGPSTLQFFDAASTLTGAAREAFADHATKEPPLPGRLIGRDDAWVPDPFDRYRAVVADYAQQIDALATLHGEHVVDRSDAWLKDRLTELGEPLASLDQDGTRLTLEVDRDIRNAQSRVWLAEEDLALLEARAAEELPAPHLRRAVEVQGDRVEALRRVAHELAAESRELPDESRYLHNRMAQDLQPAAEWLAIVREQAIREAEQILAERTTVDQALGKPPPYAKEIGRGDLSSILDEMRVERHQWRESRNDPRAARRVERGDIDAPSALDQLRDILGDERSDRLAKRVRPLANRLAELPDDWVASRHEQLADPIRLLDRHAARKTLRIEAFQKAAEERLRRREVEAAWLEKKLHPSSLEDADRRSIAETRERLAFARREASAEQSEVQHFALQAERLHQSGAHLDDQLARREDELLRAVAYADERALRRELAIRQQVERSVVDPPEPIVELIGAAPERRDPERGEWESLTRELESDRFTSRADGRSDLDRRIDRLRADRGMPALDRSPGSETAIEPPGIG